MRDIENLYHRVIEKMDMNQEMEDESLLELIHEVLEEEAYQSYMPLQEKIKISRDLFNAFRKLDILQELIEDESITEIMINGTENIFIEREGKIYQSDKRFVSVTKLEDVIQQIAAGANRYVNEASPIVDARLEDGSRVNVVLKPVALNGPIMTIRKFPKEAVTMEQLIQWGSISREAVTFLKALVEAKYNIFVSGGTGSGKTTFLNALSNFIPKDERIITIEDNAELQIKGVPNLVRLESRNANLEGKGAVTIRDLIKSALRMRPTRILVGEVRGDETVDMISSAMLNGHSGSMSTGHANSPQDMVYRLQTMMLMGIDLPLAAIQQQVSSALDIIVHLGRLRDKSRKVLEIVEVLGCEDGKIQLQSLYKYQEEGMEDGILKGNLMKVGSLQQQEKLLAAGYTEEGVYSGSLQR
ncbi:MAG: CpaF family protein [Candidatus Ruminococcus intestinipullorum]|nr:CpaF family protein [Candidatus Ruminococcus intestinipullorum]